MNQIKRLKKLGYEFRFSNANSHIESGIVRAAVKLLIKEPDSDKFQESFFAVSAPVSDPFHEVVTTGINHYLAYLYPDTSEPPKEEPKEYMTEDMIAEFFSRKRHYTSRHELHSDFADYQALTRATGWWGDYATPEQIDEGNYRKLVNSLVFMMNDEKVRRSIISNPMQGYTVMRGLAAILSVLEPEELKPVPIMIDTSVKEEE